MAALAPAALARELAPYGVQLSVEQLEQLHAYLELLLRWNRRMNLTAIREPRRIVRELFGESLFLTRVMPLAGRLLDVGSGAGFPGLVLKLAVPRLQVALLEASGRKCTFLAEVADTLQLSDVEIVCERLENYRRDEGDSFDLSTTRAVRMSADLVNKIAHLLGPTGQLIVFTTRSRVSELARIRELQWDPPVTIPGTDSRVIVVGGKGWHWLTIIS